MNTKFNFFFERKSEVKFLYYFVIFSFVLEENVSSYVFILKSKQHLYQDVFRNWVFKFDFFLFFVKIWDLFSGLWGFLQNWVLFFVFERKCFLSHSVCIKI